jgi:hypothetical protein
MERIVAHCGLLCNECPAYIATQANDVAAQERVLAEWRVAYNAPDMQLATVSCDGCLGAGGRLGGYCNACEVRACAEGRGLRNCAHCPDYECQKLQAMLAHTPEGEERLLAIRHLLQ